MNSKLVGCIPDYHFQLLVNVLSIEDQHCTSSNCGISKQQEISLPALKLIQTLTTNNPSSASTLINSYNVLWGLEKQLLHTESFMAHQGPHGKYIQEVTIKLCTNILINLLRSCNKAAKKCLFAHEIWEVVFGLLHEQTGLYIYMLELLPYFFHTTDKATALEKMGKFLEMVKKVDIGSSLMEDMGRVREIITEVYESCRKCMSC
jgi:hypothetical protein